MLDDAVFWPNGHAKDTGLETTLYNTVIYQPLVRSLKIKELFFGQTKKQIKILLNDYI